MLLQLNLAYTSLPDGGVRIDITEDADPVVGFGLSHDGALRAAALILHRAGVVRAGYENGHLQEMKRQ